MKTEQSIYSQATGWIKKSGDGLDRLAQLVFLFGNKDLLKEQKNIDFVKGAYPFAQVVGCSTSGEGGGRIGVDGNGKRRGGACHSAIRIGAIYLQLT